MTAMRNLMAALAAALTRGGRAFLKSMPVSLVLRAAISFVLAASLYVNEFNNPTPAEAAIASVAAIGTATSKASGTTLAVTVGAAGVAAGNSVIVAVALDPVVSNTVTVADTQLNTYSSDADLANGSGTSGVRTVVFSAHNITALVNTNTITVTFSAAVVAKAMSAASFSGLALISTKDVTASATGSSTAPSSGATAATEVADELVVGAIGTKGPSGDTFTVGAGYDNTNFTRAGTTGAGPTSNITIAPEYKIVSATGAQTADATLGTSRLWSAAVVTYRVKPPWDSYDNGCVSVTDTFDAPPNNVVCAKGTSIRAGTTYDIAYYDGAGAKVIEESAVPATGATLQSASYTISSCCAASTEGTWHVVAFESAATPPATYGAIDTEIEQRTNQVAADDTFTVNAPAIPELPTVLAALGMGATAAAAYLWMRRRLAYVTA